MQKRNREKEGKEKIENGDGTRVIDGWNWEENWLRLLFISYLFNELRDADRKWRQQSSLCVNEWSAVTNTDAWEDMQILIQCFIYIRIKSDYSELLSSKI